MTLSSLCPCFASPFSWGEGRRVSLLTAELFGAWPGSLFRHRRGRQEPWGWAGQESAHREGIPPLPRARATWSHSCRHPLLSPAFGSLHRLVLTSPPAQCQLSPYPGPRKAPQGWNPLGCHLRSEGSRGGFAPILASPQTTPLLFLLHIGFPHKISFESGREGVSA